MFTVWDKNKMFGMVRVISDQIMAANIMDWLFYQNIVVKELVKNSWNSVFKSFPMVIGLYTYQLTISVSMEIVVFKLRT